MSFTVTAYQNEYLPDGGTEVHAIVTVTSGGGAVVSADVAKVVVLIVDTSGSMTEPASKIRAARKAAATAVELLPDGTRFAVISGHEEAELAYPPRKALAMADEHARTEAVQAIKRLEAGGGTAISTWIDLARELCEAEPGAIRLAYLLTDGRNQSERREQLEAALRRAAGVFQCDARGVGAAWDVAELRLITSSLLGEVDIIETPDRMDDDFREFLERAIGKNVGDVRLRMWTPKGSTIRFVRQVAPSIEDLTASRVDVDALTGDYPTGAWAGEESRDYHVCVDVPPGAVGDEKLAARVSVAIGDEVVTPALVRAVWTDDEALSTRLNHHVAHYTGQAELADAIQSGLEARKSGDEAGATLKLGRAVQLAHEAGNEGTVRLLRSVVDVEDPATGTVRLKRNVETLDEMALDTRSTRTVRVSAKKAPTK
jgi:hypothetical protein